MKPCVRDYERDREILMLREEMDWTFREIAEKYNITKTRAREVYLRAKHDNSREMFEVGV